MTMLPNPCSICGKKIVGSYVGTGDGSMRNGGSFAHPECYRRKAHIPSPEAIEAAKDALRGTIKAMEEHYNRTKAKVLAPTSYLRAMNDARAALAKLEGR